MTRLSILESKHLAKELHASSAHCGLVSKLSNWHELIAHAEGYRDWNTFCARAKQSPLYNSARNAHKHVGAAYLCDGASAPRLYLAYAQSYGPHSYLVEKFAPLTNTDAGRRLMGMSVTFERPDIPGLPRPEVMEFEEIYNDAGVCIGATGIDQTRIGDQIPVVVRSAVQATGTGGVLLYIWWLDLFSGLGCDGAVSHSSSKFCKESNWQGQATNRLLELLTGATFPTISCYGVAPQWHSPAYATVLCQQGLDGYVSVAGEYFNHADAMRHAALLNQQAGISRLDAADIAEACLSQLWEDASEGETYGP